MQTELVLNAQQSLKGSMRVSAEAILSDKLDASTMPAIQPNRTTSSQVLLGGRREESTPGRDVLTP